MRALQLRAVGVSIDDADLAVEQLPPPDVGPVDILVTVEACALGARDVEAATAGPGQAPSPPVTLGREAAGTIAAVGAEVTDWQPGDRVAVLPDRPCGSCGYCRIGRENLCRDRLVAGVDHDGALATQVLAAVDRLVPLPPEVPAHEGAILADTVGTAAHAVKRAGAGDGSIIAVYGLGGVGLHVLLLAKLAGAHVVGVDLDALALERAAAWGADAVVDAGVDDPVVAVDKLTGGGADRAIEASGAAVAADQAVRSVAPGGRAVLVSHTSESLTTTHIARVAADELEIVGSGAPTVQDVGEIADLVADGRLDLGRSVSGTVALDAAAEELRRLGSRQGHAVRTVVTDLG